MATQAADRCVAVVDILGFRERVRSGSLFGVAETLRTLVKQVPKVSLYWSSTSWGPSTRVRSLSGRERLNQLLFSDTLFLWSDPAPKDADRVDMRIEGFLQGVSHVLVEALLRGIPLRAGVAYGSTLIDVRQRIIVGQPVVEAYLAEGAQEWIGGGIHDSVPRVIGASCIDYPVPVKSSASLALSKALDWTRPARVWDTEARDGKKLPRIEMALLDGARHSGDPIVRKKYDNALTFVRYVEEHRGRKRAT